MTDTKEQTCIPIFTTPLRCAVHQFDRYTPADANHYNVMDRTPNNDIDELIRIVAKECVAGPGHEIYIYVRGCRCGETEYPLGIFTVMRINSNGSDRNTYGMACGCIVSLDNIEWFFASEESVREIARVDLSADGRYD